MYIYIRNKIIAPNISSPSYIATPQSCQYSFHYNPSSFNVEAIEISWKKVKVTNSVVVIISDFFFISL